MSEAVTNHLCGLVLTVAGASVILGRRQLATDAERRRIRADVSLSPEQRAAALERMTFEKEESLRKLLGNEIYERYGAAQEQ